MVYVAQTMYVPDKDYVWSEPSTPPTPAQCSPSLLAQNEDNSADSEDKSDSTGMLNFTYPVIIIVFIRKSYTIRFRKKVKNCIQS